MYRSDETIEIGTGLKCWGLKRRRAGKSNESGWNDAEQEGGGWGNGMGEAAYRERVWNGEHEIGG
jgi:hypothetical protein